MEHDPLTIMSDELQRWAVQPFNSRYEITQVRGSERYKLDPAFREAVAMKLMLTPDHQTGSTVRDTSQLKGKHQIVPEHLAGDPNTAEEGSSGFTTMGGVGRYAVSPSEVAQVAEQQRAREAQQRGRQLGPLSTRPRQD